MNSKEIIIEQSNKNIGDINKVVNELDSDLAKVSPSEVQRLNVKVKAVNASNLAIQHKLTAEKVFTKVKAR